MLNYDFKEIEKKWQENWKDEKAFKAVDFDKDRQKYYMLYEFFNVSGNLHMGHLKATVPSDAMARMKRLQGYNVLFPIGGDAFGLPAENAAIKTGCLPQEFVEKTMEVMLGQCKSLGLSFDYSRAIATSDESFYKWTQWIFLQLLKEGKAYKQKGTVNFCPSCNTVLSNEDCQGGICDRCSSKVIQQERDVWFLKMKEYSDKLLKNVDQIEMAEGLKAAQRNWIGKSSGVMATFGVEDAKGNFVCNLDVFTTCIETIFGVTYVVVAPEHNFVKENINNFSNKVDVEEYVKNASYKSALDRIADSGEKSGVNLGGYFAVNPANGKRVPIYIADFVVANYGTGAVMSVPAHDERDYAFAKKYNIDVIQVIEGDISSNAVSKAEYISKNSKMLNSGDFDGQNVKDAKNAIAEMLVAKGAAQHTTNYKMGDWPFNRQRYWGEPFPVVFCEKCGTVALEEKDLPLCLPKVKDYMPTANGASPLAKVEDFVNCKCPICGGNAKRETDTMPNWAGSSWYWLRYADPHNNEEFANYEKLKYWGEVDCYTGGTEHITRHVLYAFFWQNFLFDIGVVPSRNAFKRKLGSGLILDDQGLKMSKSSKNGVTAQEVLSKYGADVTRLHIQFLAGFEDNVKWTFKGIEGIESFLNKVYALKDMIKGEEISKEHSFEINTLIEKVGKDIEAFKLNTAIAAFMGFIKKVRESGFITKKELEILLILLNPIAPHITSEMYEEVFAKNIVNASWPKVDESSLQKQEIEIPVQINGKKAKVIVVSKDASQEEVFEIAKNNIEELQNIEIKKIIYITGKILNIVK